MQWLDANAANSDVGGETRAVTRRIPRPRVHYSPSPPSKRRARRTHQQRQPLRPIQAQQVVPANPFLAQQVVHANPFVAQQGVHANPFVPQHIVPVNPFVPQHFVPVNPLVPQPVVPANPTVKREAWNIDVDQWKELAYQQSMERARQCPTGKHYFATRQIWPEYPGVLPSITYIPKGKDSEVVPSITNMQCHYRTC